VLLPLPSVLYVFTLYLVWARLVQRFVLVHVLVSEQSIVLLGGDTVKRDWLDLCATRSAQHTMCIAGGCHTDDGVPAILQGIWTPSTQLHQVYANSLAGPLRGLPITK